MKNGKKKKSRADDASPLLTHGSMRRGRNGVMFTDTKRFSLGDDMYSDTDPDGSYTGVPREQDEVPVQDADDL